MNKRVVSNLLLVVTAFIWGTAFVAQSLGMAHIGPFTFSGVRNLVGCAALLPVIGLIWRREGRPSPKTLRHTLFGGLWCGAVLFAAGSLQQFGILYTTVGKASFITALYIVLVPLLGLLFGRRVRAAVWPAVALGAVGLYLLCMREALTLSLGDGLVLGCALLFSAHILVIDHFSAKADCVLMSCVQFLVAGVLGIACMFLFESPSVKDILVSWGPILYAGALSSGVAYTLQIVAQRNTDPAVASLLMSLEAVFGALAGWLILGESFTVREFAGAALLFGAILLAQLPSKGFSRN